MDWKALVQTLSYGAGAIAALSSLVVYQRNSRLERTRWVSNLYSKFYEQPELKKVRDVLDGEEPNSSEIHRLVQEEDPSFTDYLNFFEFIGYLNKTGQLSRTDVDAVDNLAQPGLTTMNRYLYYLRYPSARPCSGRNCRNGSTPETGRIRISSGQAVRSGGISRSGGEPYITLSD